MLLVIIILKSKATQIGEEEGKGERKGVTITPELETNKRLDDHFSLRPKTLDCSEEEKLSL